MVSILNRYRDTLKIFLWIGGRGHSFTRSILYIFIHSTHYLLPKKRRQAYKKIVFIVFLKGYSVCKMQITPALNYNTHYNCCICSRENNKLIFWLKYTGHLPKNQHFQQKNIKVIQNQMHYFTQQINKFCLVFLYFLQYAHKIAANFKFVK